AAETVMGKFRDGVAVTGEAVTLILSTIDRIKEILGDLEQTQHEPEGSDRDLIGQLERMAVHGTGAAASEPAKAPAATAGNLIYQVVERQLRPGEVSLDELERAFRETAGPVEAAPAQEPAAAPSPAGNGKAGAAKPAPVKAERKNGGDKDDEEKVD